MPPLSYEDQLKLDEWYKASAVDVALFNSKRRRFLQLIARILGVALVLGTFGFLIFAAVDLSRQLRSAMNTPPAYVVAVTASNDVTAGSVCGYEKDGTVKCGGMKVNVTSLGVAAAFLNANPAAATSSPTVTYNGFRIDSTSGTLVFSRTAVDTTTPGAYIASTPTEEVVTFNPAVVSSSATSILAANSVAPYDAVVTLHGTSTPRSMVLTFRASGAATSTAFSQVLLGTTTTTVDAIFNQQLARVTVAAVSSGLLVVLPSSATCLVKFISGATGSQASQYDLSMIGISSCPNATAALYEQKVLIIPSRTVAILGIDTGKMSLSAQQTIPVVEQQTITATSMTIATIPAQVVGYSGFAIAFTTGTAIVVRTFALSQDGAFLLTGVTVTGPRATRTATWRFASVESVVYRPLQQDIAVISRDVYGIGMLFTVDIATPGLPSELLTIGGLSGYAFGGMSITSSGSMLVAMKPDGVAASSVAVLAALTWMGGYRIAGIAAASCSSGSVASVQVTGVSTTLRNLKPGQQYALGPQGNVILAASLPGPSVVLGEAISPEELDITLRHNRNGQ